MIRSHLFVTLLVATLVAGCSSGGNRPPAQKPCQTLTWECDDTSVAKFEVELLGAIHEAIDKKFSVAHLPPGTYTVRIRSVNELGFRSEWSTYTFKK